MVLTKLNVVVRKPILAVMLAAIAYQAGAADEGGGSETRKAALGFSAEQFDKVRALIKPKPGGYDDLPWMTDLWEARRKAAAEGKPLLVWVGDGHPLGWT